MNIMLDMELIKRSAFIALITYIASIIVSDTLSGSNRISLSIVVFMFYYVTEKFIHSTTVCSNHVVVTQSNNGANTNGANIADDLDLHDII